MYLTPNCDFPVYGIPKWCWMCPSHARWYSAALMLLCTVPTQSVQEMSDAVNRSQRVGVALSQHDEMQVGGAGSVGAY